MREIRVQKTYNRDLLVEEIMAIPGATFQNVDGEQATNIRFLGDFVIQCPDDLEKAVSSIVKRHDATKKSTKQLKDEEETNSTLTALKKIDTLGFTKKEFAALVRWALQEDKIK